MVTRLGAGIGPNQNWQGESVLAVKELEETITAAARRGRTRPTQFDQAG